MVNFTKSEMIFSKKVHQSTKLAINQILPIPIVDNFSKYLGQSIITGRVKNNSLAILKIKYGRK
jgi:hypothetical protein